MTSSSKPRQLFDRLTGATGATGIVLLACTACCIPMLAPVLAWVGVAALGLQLSGSWLAVAIGATVAASLVASLVASVVAGSVALRRRRRQLKLPTVARPATQPQQYMQRQDKLGDEVITVQPAVPAPRPDC